MTTDRTDPPPGRLPMPRRAAARQADDAPLHSAPAAGFDQPFAMLAACHERVERTLALLERLGEHLGRHGADADARQAARDVMRYFDVAGPAHHEDEERHLFPALRRGATPAVAALVQRLEAEHVELATRWREVRATLAEVTAGRWDGAMAASAAAAWSDFAAAYRRHLACEDGEAYPLAEPLFDADARAAVGREMASRRGAAG